MSLSQFTIYTSSDPYGPGPMMGVTGSLVQILDACLVNGYGSGSSYYKPAAGWTKPLANISGTLACYKQASGSQMVLYVNDSGPNVTSTAKEAWVCGFTQITSLTGSSGAGSRFTGSYGNGAGSGQFPLPQQQNTYGHCVVRKSVTADTTQRSWVVVADACTMYMWTLVGDNSAIYYGHWSFGDIYSLVTNDIGKCYIYAQGNENTALGSTNDCSDCQNMGPQRDQGNNLLGALSGHYVVSAPTGTGGSLGFARKGDPGIAANGGTRNVYITSLNGIIGTPNSYDNNLYFAPLWMVDPTNGGMRGQFRGLYQICHPISNFVDGQIIKGSGDYVGKTFIVVRTSAQQSMWAVEISPTVKTN